ncbi:MoxR family ATPase [Parafrankia sp. EUN1f]|uniref:AAA family ATPase n=1 Tax=Parafrankia sp. EUN1f TaxID=102897 RepID=UPI0001C44A2D|nr:MoxR family ATPase [Parafrankia sp. EUN1f]EFC85056.1 ATPase associated with various cellular activities AAA_3 [Parafrankia sp. EUN1f]
MTSPPAAGAAAGDAEVTWFRECFEALHGNIGRFVRGKPEVIRLALVCLAAEGHILIDDVPGVGKTSLAKAIASSIEGGLMRRIQFTPDLLPTDVTGVQIWNAESREFEFQPGAVFGNVVLADEINRASPKTQSALLEVMEERQVTTTDSIPYEVPRPFIVIATQNPVEHGGTYDLPEAQIDRFMARLHIGYPRYEAEVEILANGARGVTPRSLSPVVSISDVQRMTQIVRRIHLAPALLGYIVMIVSETRRIGELRLGVSPRGGMALAVAAQAHAAAAGRSFVKPEDVQALAPYVLGHRMLLRPEAELSGATSESLLGAIMTSMPVPDQRVSSY